MGAKILTTNRLRAIAWCEPGMEVFVATWRAASRIDGAASQGDEKNPATRADGRALAALGTAPTEIGMSNPANR